MNVNDSGLSHCTCCLEVFIPITSLKHRELLLDILKLGVWGRALSFQNHLFRVEKMEQNSSFYSKRHYLAVFTFAQHKAAVLIFFFLTGPSTKFFLQLSALQDVLDYILLIAILFFFSPR